MRQNNTVSFTKGMTFHQYFNCGKKKFVNYSNLEFQSGLVILEPSEECISKLIVDQGKKRTGRGLNSNLLCEASGCIQSFANLKDLEDNIEAGNHRFTS